MVKCQSEKRRGAKKLVILLKDFFPRNFSSPFFLRLSKMEARPIKDERGRDRVPGEIPARVDGRGRWLKKQTNISQEVPLNIFS